MTEDQIKAIAEEFARLKNFNPGFHKEEKEMAKLFEQFVNFIQMRYCIAEREKVMKAIHILQNDADMFEFRQNAMAR